MLGVLKKSIPANNVNAPIQGQASKYKIRQTAGGGLAIVPARRDGLRIERRGWTGGQEKPVARGRGPR